MSHTTNPPDRRFCLAPMMDWSDSHCRYFWRLLSQRAMLYTEMITTGALLRGDRDRFLHYNAAELPLALQLGGSNPQELARCAQLAREHGYSEVNLNCGCPSDRVQNNRIGACLMSDPVLVADCVAAMIDAVDLPVTVKHRTGIDEFDSYGHLQAFVGALTDAGCGTIIVHARKAWLKGLSPRENREIPPLEYHKVARLKQDFPQLEIIINGGITTLDQCQTLLAEVDGVMIGREAYSNPYLLAAVDRAIYGTDTPTPSRRAVAEAFLAYCEEQLARGVRLSHMTRHILGLYQGQPRGRLFRRLISEEAHRPGAGAEVLRRAIELVETPQL